jgi:glycosyltransferase involved in cell wall biosynthesis
MKILIVSNYLPPKIGGIEKISHELANALGALDDVEVTVACAKWPSQYVNSEWEDISILYQAIYLPSITVKRRLPIPNVLSVKFWTTFLNFPKDYDLIFFQSHLFVLNWMLIVRLRTVKRRVWMNQGCNYVPMLSYVSRRLSYMYERIGIFIMSKFANEFIGQSWNTAQWISDKCGREFRFLNNAINTDTFNSNAETVSSFPRTRVLYVGRLVEGKGLVDCINAVQLANKILIDLGDRNLFELNVIGSGDFLMDKSLSVQNLEISFLGELSHKEVIKQMYQSDILIQAYTQPEGITTVTLEGLASGMLVVSTPLGGDGILEECDNFSSGAIHELPSLLLRARENLESRQQLIVSGYGHVERNFSWKINAKKLVLGDYAELRIANG